MLDHLLEMPDDEPVHYMSCPHCHIDMTWHRCSYSFSCPECDRCYDYPIYAGPDEEDWEVCYDV